MRDYRDEVTSAPVRVGHLDITKALTHVINTIRGREVEDKKREG